MKPSQKPFVVSLRNGKWQFKGKWPRGVVAYVNGKKMKRHFASPSKRSSKEEKYSKRSKKDKEEYSSRGEGFESAVLYVRNLPLDVIEPDIHNALSKYGPIAYVLCIKSKGQAFVEFEDIDSAKTLISKAKKNHIKIAGELVVFEYSKSQFIRRSGLESSAPNQVLMFTVHNVQYPITVDVIHQISNRNGNVVRIAMIKGKDDYEVQALVEFDSVDTAKKAKQALNGQFIYKGCCYLKVEFAKVDRVNITKNTTERWDYTIEEKDEKSIKQKTHHHHHNNNNNNQNELNKAYPPLPTQQFPNTQLFPFQGPYSVPMVGQFPQYSMPVAYFY